MPKKQAPKRELEEPGDLSVSLAPTPAKKTKPALVAGGKRTRAAAKLTNSDNNTNSPLETPMLKQTQTISKPKEDPVRSQPTPAPTKINSQARPKKSANNAAKAPKAQDDHSPTELAVPVAEIKKGGRPKKPSPIAEKANQQVVAKQNAKEAQAAKKAKKAEVAVNEETPEETAAFLAKAKGQSRPATTSSSVTSPKRQKPLVNREKAMEQLLNARLPPPKPTSAASSTSTMGHIAQTGVIASDTSTPPARKIVTQTTLQVPRSTPPSRDVSPVAPPLLEIPLSASASREVSPSAESMATVEDEYDEDIDISVNYQAILRGIPKPWNLGPISMPPTLPEPLHTAKVRPEVLGKATNGGKDKPKVA